MQLSETFVPMKNPADGEDEGIGIAFGAVGESARKIAEQAAGKVLFVVDAGTLAAFSRVSSSRAVFVVFEGDALPLFLMPDGVSCIVAAGSAATVRAARYFAEVRSVPCRLFPADAALDGVFDRMGSVLLGGERFTAPLAQPSVVCDLALMRPSFAEAYARLLLGRLALFEEQAAAGILRREKCSHFEKAYLAVAHLSEDERHIVRKNAALRRMEAEGLSSGEGAFLTEREGLSAWQAYRTLLRLYFAFFYRGKPRKYVVADYLSRAREAGVSYAEMAVPTAEEYALRALALERNRAADLRALRPLREGLPRDERAVRTLAGSLPQSGPAFDSIRYLPERHPQGLCALIRDFGLMEWK